MGYREYRQEKKAAQVAELVKRAMQLPAGATATVMPNTTIPTGPYGQMTPMAQALARSGASFGAAMGPGVPLVPVPLDPADPRAPFRRYQYDISHNLNINQRQALWNTLRGAAQGIDVLARCIQIRTADVIRMDLTFGVSQDAISNIMVANNISASEASKIARTLYAPEVDRMKQFWENPYPEDNRTWEEFLAEMMWQLLVFDGLAIAPAFNLGAKCIGLEIIDAPTINILLDNGGRRPLPPAPAFQQNLWGYVRTEAVGNQLKGKSFQDGGAPYDVTAADVLSYFILNPRTNTPYGWSPVETSLPIADLYAEYQKWQISEFKSGTTSKLYFESSDEAITIQNLSTVERMLNEQRAGITDARYQMKIIPPGLTNPYEPKTIEEVYKADYAEHWLKQIASFFNIAPAQLGVIARAGLGGGKGASEGAADETESISSKPQNRQLEGIINSLSRQHLGCDRNVVAMLKNDEGSQDRLEQANAFKVLIDNAMMTPNQAAQELGFALSTEPEADELAYVTATGPVFLKGLLDAQATSQELAKQPPPAPVIMQPKVEGDTTNDNQASGKETNGKTQDQVQQSEEGGKGQTEVAKLAEAQAYKKFSAKPRTREFIFEYHSPEEVESLKVGLAPLGKSHKPHKAEAKLRAIAQSHAPKIGNALKLTGVATAVAGAVVHANQAAHLLDDASATQIATLYSKQTGIDAKALQLRLVSLYQEVGQEALDQFAAQSGQAAGSVDLAGLLSKADITISGINDTQQSHVLTAIKDGLTQGKGISEISADIKAQVEGPMRLGQADLIARTETTRAYSEVFAGQLADAGYATWEWVTEGSDPCQECLDAAGIKDVADTDYPPLHPNCQCAPEVPSA